MYYTLYMHKFWNKYFVRCCFFSVHSILYNYCACRQTQRIQQNLQICRTPSGHD